MLEDESLRSLRYGNNEQYFKGIEPYYLILGHMAWIVPRCALADHPCVVLDRSE